MNIGIISTKSENTNIHCNILLYFFMISQYNLFFTNPIYNRKID